MLRALRVCVLVGFVLTTAACADPPNKEMDQAQGALDAARAAGAEQYAGQELNAATDSLKRSEEAVTQRDYRLALNLAIESRERAQAAAKAAVENRAKARGDAERIVAEANSAVTQARAQLDAALTAKLPRRNVSDAQKAFDSAEKHMQDARAALAQDDYPRARQAADAATTGAQEGLAVLQKPVAPAAPRKRR